MSATNKAPEDIVVRFPRFFKEANLGGESNLETRIKILKENNGQLALINDDHYSPNEYLLARIKFDPDDKSCYFVQLLHQDNFHEIRLHYHDLKRVLIAEKANAFYKIFEGK